ncbi:MAG: hypothetical protein IJ728_00490 [Selenomonadaceae bacterium]|nr:hypothetical protein [Selenomonadaceae bacterium]
MEETSSGLLPPILSDIFIFLGVVLSLILLIAFAYIWSTQRQDREDIRRLFFDMKNLSQKVKDLETGLTGKSEVKKDEPKAMPEIKLPEPEPKQIVDKKKLIPEEKISHIWDEFLENYNHIAESMAVPGQLRACENFVSENALKILVYIGSMKFSFASNVQDSKFWAWKIESSDKYAVVPNPLTPYNDELHNKAGMKETFASNYEIGSYKKYFVELPAILVYVGKNEWKISEPGVIRLER